MGATGDGPGPAGNYESPFYGYQTKIGTLLSYLYPLAAAIFTLGVLLMFEGLEYLISAEPSLRDVFVPSIVFLELVTVGAGLIAYSIWLAREGPRRFSPRTRISMAGMLLIVLAMTSTSIVLDALRVGDYFDLTFILSLVSALWALCMFLSAVVDDLKDDWRNRV